MTAARTGGSGADALADPPAVASVDGADPLLVGPLLAQELHDPRWLDCSVELLSGGMSNLTYRVRSDGGDVVLRRPPLGHILPTAHDMTREFRVLTALNGTGVPVPRTLLLAGPDSPLGVSFYVMERSIGHICRNAFPDGYADTESDRRAIGEALVDVLAELHTTPPDAVGLGDFGRPAGFTARQVRRWTDQWQRSKTAELPALDELADQLGRALPPEGPGAIVHGDYRLDNVVLHPNRAGDIVAVLDWELSTLGDPLMDLGALMAYWSDPDDDEVRVRARVVPALTAQTGFPTRAEVMERYARRTGFDVSQIDWYQAFAYFKVAVICQGIAARLAEGAMGDQNLDVPEGLVEALIAAGLQQLDRGR